MQQTCTHLGGQSANLKCEKWLFLHEGILKRNDEEESQKGRDTKCS